MTGPLGSGRSDFIGLKTVRSRHLPHPRVKLAVHFTGQQFPRFQEHVQLREQFDLGGRHAPHQMLGRQLRRMIEAGRREHFRQGLEGVAVEVEDALGLVRDHEGALAQGVLGGNAGRAFVGVAALRLDAAWLWPPKFNYSSESE